MSYILCGLAPEMHGWRIAYCHPSTGRVRFRSFSTAFLDSVFAPWGGVRRVYKDLASYMNSVFIISSEMEALF